MSHPFPKCPGAMFSTPLPMRGSSQECHNLISYWTEEKGIIHESLTHEQKEGSVNSPNPQELMEIINKELVISYTNQAQLSTVCIEEMWLETTGFFPLSAEPISSSLPRIRLFYRASLNASGNAATLSHLHNRVKNELTALLKDTVTLQINSQLLVC